MEEVAGEVMSSRQKSRGVSTKRWETGALKKNWRRARARSRTPDGCMSGSSCSIVQGVHREASQSTESERQRHNGTSNSTRDRGSGDVVGGELDAISMLNETEKSDTQRQDEVRHRRNDVATKELAISTVYKKHSYLLFFGHLFAVGLPHRRHLSVESVFLQTCRLLLDNSNTALSNGEEVLS